MFDAKRLAAPCAVVQLGKERAEPAVNTGGEPSRGRRANVQAMTDARVDPAQRVGEGHIFEPRQSRQTAGRDIAGRRDRKACADERAHDAAADLRAAGR